MTNFAVEMLQAARRIANHAMSEGVLLDETQPRISCDHMGAVLADSVLQAGLNYSTVVRPRVLDVLLKYPGRDTVSSLIAVISDGETGSFLKWRHREKVVRFETLVSFLQKRGVENVQDLRLALASDEFCHDIQIINGIGPKTVDYMACLVGIDSIAVDRHVRAFAKAVSVENNDYHFLRASFCCAADLLAVPRREFDAWLWRRAVAPTQTQLALAV